MDARTAGHIEPLTQADREQAVALIARAVSNTGIARDVAEQLGLEGVAERLSWALEFMYDARKEAEGRR